MATVIDKRWIKSKDRIGRAFMDGVKNFIDLAVSHMGKKNSTRCPCNACLNNRMLPVTEVSKHILRNGFWEKYERWIHHGEAAIEDVVDSRVIGITNIADEEMLNVLDDLRGFDGAEGSLVGAVGMDEEHGNKEKRGYYDSLFEEMQTELYPGCTKIGSLNFIAKLMHIKVKNKWTNTSLTELLQLLCHAFPEGHNLPASYDDTHRKLKSLGLGYETIDVCLNDCVIYWKENKSLDRCPICGESRWDPKKGKRVPHKKLRYFPLTPRLQRLYASRHTAKEMTWHHTGRCSDKDVLRHPVDGVSWQKFNECHTAFASEPRNVRLALAADGFNPFSSQNNPYSMWPVILTTYNLPPWICMKDSTFMLTLLIPGPRSPGKDMDVFLRPLVDELKKLWNTGVRTVDAHSGEEFIMRACLLSTINDFPARSYLSGWTGQGYKACPECMNYTPSIRVNKGTVYFDHRRWLPIEHRFRRNIKLYGVTEHRPPPRRHSAADIETQLNGLTYVLPGKHKDYGGKKRKQVSHPEFNWKKKSIFYELPYWSKNLLKHNIDVMHCEKNVCDSLLGTVVCLDGKVDKDNVKARLDLEKMGIRKELWLYKDDRGRLMQPHSKFAMTPDKRHAFLVWLKEQKFPDGFASNLRNNVQAEVGKIIGMKSHDCHIMIQFLFVASIPGLIEDKSISDAIIGLCNVFRRVCKRSLSMKELEEGKADVVVLMCKLEMIFPPAFFDIMIHLVVHLYEEAQLGGPVQMRWMYPFERFLKKLKEYIRNAARPEGSIAEGYVVEETLTFVSRYLQEEKTKFNDGGRYGDVAPVPRQLSVFRSQCQSLGKKEYCTLEPKEKEIIDWYILINCEEIQVYMKEHKDLIQGSLREVEKKHRREFPRWFLKKMFTLGQAGDPVVTDEIMALADMSKRHVMRYDSCVINGVKWVSLEKGKKKVTQDYGVCSFADDITWYGELLSIICVEYVNGYSTVLFECNWYNTDVRRGRMKLEHGVTKINTSDFWCKNDPYILATQAKKVFYVDDLLHSKGVHEKWKVVWEANDRQVWDAELWGAETAGSGTESIAIPILNAAAETDQLHLARDDLDCREVSSGTIQTPQSIEYDDDDDVLDDTLDEYADDQMGDDNASDDDIGYHSE